MKLLIHHKSEENNNLNKCVDAIVNAFIKVYIKPSINKDNWITLLNSTSNTVTINNTLVETIKSSLSLDAYINNNYSFNTSELTIVEPVGLMHLDTFEHIYDRIKRDSTFIIIPNKDKPLISYNPSLYSLKGLSVSSLIEYSKNNHNNKLSRIYSHCISFDSLK